MVEYDVENNVDVLAVRLVHQGAQFLLGHVGTRREARLDAQEILYGVTMITALAILRVLQRGRNPDSSHAQFFQIRQLLKHTIERAALKTAIGRVIRQVARRRGWIVEAIKHQKINPLVAPVFRRSKWRRNFNARLIEGYDAAVLSLRPIQQRARCRIIYA